MAQDYIVTYTTPQGTVSAPNGGTIELPIGDVVSDTKLVTYLQSMPTVVTLEAITSTVANAIAGTGRTAPIVRH